MSFLPQEIWEGILDLLDTDSLLNLQASCRCFASAVVSYACRGRLKERALSCFRLELADGSLDHRRRINNVLSFSTSAPIILCGVGLYHGDDEEVLDESLHVTFDRATDSVEVTGAGDGERKAYAEVTMTIEQARRELRRDKERIRARIPNTYTMWFKRPPRLEAREVVDLRHNLSPTDVSNHFTGAPFTVLGAELWTCYGSTPEGRTTFRSHGVEFRFAKSALKGRCCLEEGQMPYLRFWKLP